MDKITLYQELRFGPFLRLHAYRYFSRPLIILLYLAGGFNVFVILTNWNQAQAETLSLGPFWVMLIIFVALPTVLYVNTASLFYSSNLLKEANTFEVSDQGVRITGQHYEAQFGWKAFFEIKEYPHWMLFYTSRHSALYLHKGSFENLSDWYILRSLIRSQPALRHRLRK